jgi:lipid-A-disaccharide synthase
MLGIISEFPGYQFIIAGVKTLPKDTYDRIIRGRDVKVITGSTYDLISHAKAAIVTSGTATLETGLLGVPQVVCYRMSFLTALLAWMFIRVENISLVNLVLGRKSVAELIQYRFNTRSLSKELRLILENEDNYKRIKSDYLEMINRLGESGASAKVAQLIIKKMFDTKPSKK